MVYFAPTVYKQFTKLTLTISHSPCKIKLDAFYFIFCMFYVAARAFVKEPFLPTNIQPQQRLNNCLYYTPFRAHHCKCNINYCKRDRHPLAAYMVQAICQLRNQSRVRVRVKSVRAASSNNTE